MECTCMYVCKCKCVCVCVCMYICIQNHNQQICHIKSTVFWNVIPCSPKGYTHFLDEPDAFSFKSEEQNIYHFPVLALNPLCKIYYHSYFSYVRKLIKNIESAAEVRSNQHVRSGWCNKVISLQLYVLHITITPQCQPLCSNVQPFNSSHVAGICWPHSCECIY